MAKHIIQKTLMDPKHWIGWIMTFIVIIGLLWLYSLYNLGPPRYYLVVLFFAIIIVDVIKHYIGLQ